MGFVKATVMVAFMRMNVRSGWMYLRIHRLPVTVNCVRLALCESRHPMPDEVEGSIFPETVNPTELLRLRATCKRSLDAAVLANEYKYLVCYVTGLSVALVEVINWCTRNNIHLVLMHFNRETGEYYPQEID